MQEYLFTVLLQAQKVMDVLDAGRTIDGLLPVYINPDTGDMQGGKLVTRVCDNGSDLWRVQIM